MIIAVDFDGTIVENEFPRVGTMRKNADVVLRRLASEGHRLLLWTCRDKDYLVEALEFLRNAGIPMHAINENVPGLSFDTSVKVFYDVLIDDRQLGGIPDDWEDIYNLLARMRK